MIVADTSPINYLILIDRINLLPQLYHRVLIPPAVHHELNAQETPSTVLTWRNNLPEWIEIGSDVPPIDPTPTGLHPGEIEAISLALHRGIGTVMMDEKRGREEAEKRGLNVIGTLGVLVSSHELGLADLRDSIDRLIQTTFHISPRLLATILEAHQD